MKIDLELLRRTVLERVRDEADGNLYQWCTRGNPRLNQGSIHRFLSGHRGVGIKIFLLLCLRMKIPPTFFYSSSDKDVLKQRLSLLAQMAADPRFPFGEETFFGNLALQIESFFVEKYSKYAVQEDQTE